MKKQLSDEQIDNLMKVVLKDASLNDADINDIADSPTLWWSIQREINVQKEAVSPWPPAIRRWLMVGVPAVAALALLSIFVFRPTGEKTEQAGLQQNVTSSVIETPSPTVSEPAVPANPENYKVIAKTVEKGNRTIRASASNRGNDRKIDVSTIAANVVERKSEIKSDFIALTYARSPESGQVVRVKVPSSMMVTLGLVSSVEKPTNLVDAEVVVGDDGMTHAIRFIR